MYRPPVTDKRLTLIGALVITAAALAACGGDDDSGGGRPVHRIGGRRERRPLDRRRPGLAQLRPRRLHRQCREVTIDYENGGNLTHTLLIDGVDDFKLSVSANGDTDEGTAELEPGDYRIYCDIPGHESMEAMLTVE